MKGITMRNSRLTKIVTVILASVLLCCSFLMIGAAAETSVADENRVTVVSKNVSYEARMELVFALTCDDLAENEEVVLLFWETAPDLSMSAEELYKSALYRKYAFADEQTVLDYENCYLYKSNGIAADKLCDDIYVLPVIKAVDASGDAPAITYEKGADLINYSVKTYAETKLAEPGMATDVIHHALYTNLLRYAEAASKVFAN